MNPTATITSDPLPGYVITERIGSGGYGEVFKAIAPGGIEKAVKSLYGYHDEELATRELKALERIKGVRHPFLLSLDRFEVVDGRLYVVTELADGSLDDCFQEYRRQGQVGIPRDELIGYLRDAADALDYMQDHHGLQHLDVKPENLLIVGGHVKVADFGLVKDVARMSQYSQVGGMTPTYAAPELFDNRPGTRTDQYSLAIVYQELLTGMLPFPGQTAAQLVAQHTGAEPRVSSLPEHDQPVIRQALAKKPDDRFPSCRALVEALLVAADKPKNAFSDRLETPQEADSADAVETRGNRADVTEHMAQDADGGESEASLSDSARRWAATERIGSWGAEEKVGTPAHAAQTPAPEAEEHVPEVVAKKEVVDVSVPEIAEFQASIQPTLLIGLGGQATGVLQRVRQNLLAQDSDCDWQQLVPMLVLDTDRSNLRRIADSNEGGGRATIETHLMPLKITQHYRRSSSDILQWLSRRWFYNIPRSLQTGGFRPLGRLALVDNAESVMKCITDLLSRITNREQLQSCGLPTNMICCHDKPRVILVASTSGGTGSGTALDLARAIRNITRAYGTENLELVGVFGDCCTGSGDARDLALVNTLAFLWEYSSMGRQGNRSNETPHERTALFEGDCLPFDHTYYVSGLGSESRLSVEQWIEQTAEYLFTDIASGCGPLLDACRVPSNSESTTLEESDKVRGFVVAPLDESREVVAQLAEEKLCELVAKYLRRRSAPRAIEEPPKKSRKKRARPKVAVAPSAPGDPSDSEPGDTDPVACLEAAMQSEFGSATNSVFATQMTSELQLKLRMTTETLQENSDLASGYHIHQLVRHAFENFMSVVCQFASEGPEGEVMSARCLRAGDQNSAPDDASLGNGALSTLVEEVARQSCGSFFAALVEAPKLSELDLGEFLQGTVSRALAQLVGSADGDSLIEQLASCQVNMFLIVKKAAIGPAGCGHERRSLVIIPEQGIDGSVESEIKTLLPSATMVRGKVSRPLLIREAANLSIAQIAATVVDDRPDLLEAARRLHTRKDLALLPLPRVVSAAGNS